VSEGASEKGSREKQREGRRANIEREREKVRVRETK